MSTLTIFGEVGGGRCERQFRSFGGPSEVRSAASFPAPWESSSERGPVRSGIVRGLVIIGVGD